VQLGVHSLSAKITKFVRQYYKTLVWGYILLPVSVIVFVNYKCCIEDFRRYFDL
jgi:hypothetical protein